MNEKEFQLRTPGQPQCGMFKFPQILFCHVLQVPVITDLPQANHIGPQSIRIPVPSIALGGLFRSLGHVFLTQSVLHL